MSHEGAFASKGRLAHLARKCSIIKLLALDVCVTWAIVLGRVCRSCPERHIDSVVWDMCCSVVLVGRIDTGVLSSPALGAEAAFPELADVECMSGLVAVAAGVPGLVDVQWSVVVPLVPGLEGVGTAVHDPTEAVGLNRL
jgi:hypothetical protein